MPFHYEIRLPIPLPDRWDAEVFWAIGNHPFTVSWERLDMMLQGKDQYGKRRYHKQILDTEHVDGIKRAVLHGLGMEEFLTDG